MNRSFPTVIMTIFLLAIAISNTMACDDAECGPDGYCNMDGRCYQCNPAGVGKKILIGRFVPTKIILVCDQDKTCCPGICQNSACCRLQGQCKIFLN